MRKLFASRTESMMKSAIRILGPVALLASAARSPQSESTRLDLGHEFTLELEAAWSPLTGTVYGFEKKYEVIRSLAPATERANYARAAFQPLLPVNEVRVGDVWSIDPKSLVAILKQLHPGATDRLHHGWFGNIKLPGNAEGAYACLRALGPKHAEVLLRVHADFLLDGDGSIEKSSWITPAQFEGHLLLDRAQGVVSWFELSLPQQSANVDVNIAEERGVMADIGRFDRMELKGGVGISTPDPLAAEVSVEEARQRLARKFYEFASIEWLPLGEALSEAVKKKKPLHVVILFGSLLDESC
jgi:hypothetical protein